MSELVRGMGWMLAGATLAMVTDGFGTFTPPQKASETIPKTAPPTSPDVDSELLPSDPTSRSSVSNQTRDRSGEAPKSSESSSKESIRKLQFQIDQLERLLTERRNRRRPSSPSETKAPSPSSAQQPPSAVQLGDFSEQLLTQKGDLLPGGTGAEVDVETQRQVLEIAQDLKRQLESGQLDRYRQIDQMIEETP